MKYLILLSGKINSGKNQYAKFLEEDFKNKGLKVRQDLYAGDLKQFSKEDFKVLGDVLKDKIERIKTTIGVVFDPKYGFSTAYQNQIYDMLDELTFKDENFYEDKTDITRVLLQTYGTEIARRRFDNQFWVKTMANRINNDTETDVIIVTDVRFPNEIEDIHDFIKGWRIVPIRIERDIPQQDRIKEHPSETALDDYEFWEYIIDNNGTLEELKSSSESVSKDILMPD